VLAGLVLALPVLAAVVAAAQDLVEPWHARFEPLLCGRTAVCHQTPVGHCASSWPKPGGSGTDQPVHGV
jgi:hypothetical protein